VEWRVHHHIWVLDDEATFCLPPKPLAGTVQKQKKSRRLPALPPVATDPANLNEVISMAISPPEHAKKRAQNQ